MTCQIHRASKKQKYDPNSGFPTPELVPQTSTRAASPQSLVWPTRGTCPFQIHFLHPGTAPAPTGAEPILGVFNAVAGSRV